MIARPLLIRWEDRHRFFAMVRNLERLVRTLEHRLGYRPAGKRGQYYQGFRRVNLQAWIVDGANVVGQSSAWSGQGGWAEWNADPAVAPSEWLQIEVIDSLGYHLGKTPGLPGQPSEPAIVSFLQQTLDTTNWSVNQFPTAMWVSGPQYP